MTVSSKLILHLILRDIYTSLGSHQHQLHNTAPSLAGGRRLPPIRARQQVGPCCGSAWGVPGEQEDLTCWWYECNYYDKLTLSHCHYHSFCLLFTSPALPRTQSYIYTFPAKYFLNIQFSHIFKNYLDSTTILVQSTEIFFCPKSVTS